uniref:Uncharacterized protein n=1 Tax=Caenorhabditis japonica TaxID=281687 RepID=A0A8R1ESD9_CAEJA
MCVLAQHLMTQNLRIRINNTPCKKHKNSRPVPWTGTVATSCSYFRSQSFLSGVLPSSGWVARNQKKFLSLALSGSGTMQAKRK